MHLPAFSASAERPARVLIAEDDDATASALQVLLQGAGYEVLVAADGAEALRIIDEGPALDVLLLDWKLPEVSGLEICRRVRATWDPLSLPILMVTAKMDATSITTAYQAGVSDYLPKPFHSAELRARIAAHLRIKQLVEERRRMDESLREREKLAVLGLLVSGVAHDLNNPLAGIGGCTQYLLEDETDPAKRDALLRISSEVQRCNRIVGDLLSFVRHQPTDSEEVDIEEVLRSTVELREGTAQDSGIRVHLEVDPGLPEIWGNEHQLQQVFLNIYLNAEQALRHGGQTLRLQAGLAAESLRSDASQEWVSISFFNDGPRIPPEVLPRIFDPFFTTKGAREGTGLGLAICQRIVREHGGRIEAESGEDGTTFRVLLPTARMPARGAQPVALR